MIKKMIGALSLFLCFWTGFLVAFVDLQVVLWYDTSEEFSVKWRGRKGMRESLEKNRKMLFMLLKAFLSAFALTAVFHAPLVAAVYEEKIDFYIASVYELLGNYDFHFLLILVAAFAFFKGTEEKSGEQKPGYGILSVFFAGCLLLGRSYHEAGNWSYLFGSPVNFIKSALALLGYACLFHAILCLFANWLKKTDFTTAEEHFFTHRPFLKAFLILSAFYGVFLIISYPGNLCYDVIGQIEQVTAGKGFSAHHPLAHTLLAGGLTQLGKTLFGSYEIGLFLYMWVQLFLFAAALAGTIMVLSKRGLKKCWLLTVLLLYMMTPIYSNLVSTALKDVPFVAFVIGYLVCFAMVLEKPGLLKNVKFDLVFVLLQVCVILFRNNGLPLVLISGVGGFLFSLKKYGAKEKIKSFAVYMGVGVLTGVLCTNILSGICNAQKGGKGEILSIPFQQTARYLQLYGNELDEEEKTAIEAVFGDAQTVAAKYDPDISDPVKALFDKEAGLIEIVNYMGAWGRGLVKHPAVYLEAFFHHVYGWFSPGVSNVIRYETDYEVIEQQGLFSGASKLMIFFYRFLGRVTPLSVLENVGMAVWALFFITAYQCKDKKKNYVVATLPLWVSLLVCMASPCFFGHPRYALPILATLPFLYGFMLTKKKEDESNAVYEK